MGVEASRIKSREPTYAPNQCVDGAGVSVARSMRVLVIDDDSSMQHMIMNYLKQQNMRAIAASRRQEAIRQFTASEPDVVILDLQLGQEDGLDLLREITSVRFVEPGLRKSPAAIGGFRESLLERIWTLVALTDDQAARTRP